MTANRTHPPFLTEATEAAAIAACEASGKTAFCGIRVGDDDDCTVEAVIWVSGPDTLFFDMHKNAAPAQNTQEGRVVRLGRFGMIGMMGRIQKLDGAGFQRFGELVRAAISVDHLIYRYTDEDFVRMHRERTDTASPITASPNGRRAPARADRVRLDA